ncbi:uncharacterized protein F4807DRAFT_211921 [Annulohypoxylon truncatum]|uniref:uncharacterized protein n=1 Tax=Annulohypoxylon truncatum TaxID=327061 RepID=UPI0020089AF9|nr:uncharacterized protein F4807DRAFT_211921 [Annulohypoxylon truncatum]KAI1207037.1 hypothetical protein F4807DRAFT_211921 [Annulohypoxylon truncatum]
MSVRQGLRLLALLGLSNAASAQNYPNSSSSASDTVAVSWIGDTPKINSGTTFGLPWPRGKYQANSTTFAAHEGDSNDQVPLQSWVLASWPDGSIKWSAHAVGASETVYDEYKVTASTTGGSNAKRSSNSSSSGLTVSESDSQATVDTGKISATFPRSGSILVGEIKTSSGKVVGQNGRLILRSQSGVEDDDDDGNSTSINKFQFESNVDNSTIEYDDSSIRALVTVRGTHKVTSGAHDDLLPFILRFYLYANSDIIRVVHTLIFDNKVDQDFISGIGIRFDVPLSGEELYNRHIRLAGPDGGLLREAVQGITGLRRDPGEEVRTAQYNGTETPDVSTWDTTVSSRLKWIPPWSDYSLTQLSPDGFTLKKRTKSGQGWVKVPGGTQSGGLAYLGGATQGGLAVALRDFWKRYPTGIDISNAASDVGQITLWLYSPSAGPMDLRPFHDKLGEDTYAEQSDALEITYEDYEEGWDTPYGIARTNELFLFPFDNTPPADTLASLIDYANEPPQLAAEPQYIQDTKAIGSYWATIPDNSSAAAQTIESHFDFLIKYYQDQISQRRWYGFWDHGDIMHTYDTDRHTWRYDVGGYAWDNSELSPNLFFWNYFLRTGRADVYRFAEAHARHTGEVDVYHIGPYKGFGTRHGVDHWSDSSKQIRVSTPIYRQVFYYLSGGDERVGELLHELMDADKTFLIVDPRRKVRDPNITYVIEPTAIDLDLGLDWSGLASTWFIELERRGSRWEEARSKLNASMHGIAALKNGFVTGLGLYNIYTGDIAPPLNDPQNLGVVAVTHLPASFGLPEIISQIADYLGDDFPKSFESVWLDYCYYYGASAAEQTARYGVSFGNLNLKQGHSRLTAYAAKKLGNSTLAARAWNEFLNTDGLSPDEPWATEAINGSLVLSPVDEAAWLATNDAALYGLAGIENLAQIAYAL